MASISFLSSSAAHFSGVKLTSDELHSLPSQVNFRTLRVSAACATSTAGRASFSRIGSFYKVLGIQTGASIGEIKSAYRKLARVLHPDVAAEGQKESRAFEFIRIHEAYETLSDPAKRADYDRLLFRPMRAPYMASANAATVARYAAASGFSLSPRRRWETDQCW